MTAYSGLQATDASPKPRSLLLDKATGAYVSLPYLSALPSPDGTRVLVRTGDDTPSSPLRSGILDPGTGNVRWISTYTGQGTWSPDGTEILFTVRARLSDTGFAIVDAATLKASFAKVDFTEDNSTGLDFVWAPSGQEVAITVSHSGGQESQIDPVTGVRFYNRGGMLTHSVPATAELQSEYAFSPRGTQIALHDDPVGGAPARIVDANTGTVQKTVRLSGRNDIVGWADDNHLIVRHWADDLSGSQLRIVNLAGHVDTSVNLRVDASIADQVVVGSAEDLSPNAAGLAF
ncbi:hypothetical protein [Rugosimonospora africana]|uniref:hypothetical protein n=1 Tax=Rugosimonospora africana TaxID=556532 RepID=UPI0019440A3C|nr:hypothetical protein [Rugosimonospora africana]